MEIDKYANGNNVDILSLFYKIVEWKQRVDVSVVDAVAVREGGTIGITTLVYYR